MRKKLSVNQDGWLSEAMNAVNAGEPISVHITGPAVMDAMRRIQGAVNKLPLLDLWKAVKAFVPQAGLIPVDPTMVIPVLAAMGAGGGAVGSAAFVACVGAAHKMKPSLTYNPGALLDPSDDELVITLEAA